MADVRVVAGTAHAGAVALNALATITIGGLVQAAAEVVRAPDTTVADLQRLAAILQDTLCAAERLRTTSAANRLEVAMKIATIVATVRSSEDHRQTGA